MAANTRARALDYGVNSKVTSTEMQTIQVQAAQSVNRTNTTTRWRSVPVCFSGCPDGSNIVHIHGDRFDNTEGGGADYPQAYFDLIGLPDGHDLDGVRVKYFPAGGHTGVPANLPSITIFRTQLSTNVTSTLGIGGCAGIALSTYAAGVMLSTSFTASEIDNGIYRYWMAFDSEYGTDSVSGARFSGVQAHVIIDATEGGPDFIFW